tara:strand:- start:16 stop:645 length:630 start_codon:yes stop_codon:yes gene_type:complete
MQEVNIKDLLKDKISKTGKSPSKAIQFEPLKLVKTFTTKFTKDFKITIPSLGESIPPPPPRVIFSVKKGDRVSVTEFFNGRTIFVIDGEKWYKSQLKNKKELKEILDGSRERPKNWNEWSKVGLGYIGGDIKKLTTDEQIQAKIDEPIQIGVFDKTLKYDNNKSAYRVDKSYLASNSKLGFGDPIKNKKWLVYGLIAVGGYFAYKKFKK